MIACPITRQQKGYPFEVVVPGGTALEGVFLVDQIRSLDWSAREVRPLLTDGSPVTVPESTMADVLGLLRRLLLD
jgi:mRNA interferase MazF